MDPNTFKRALNLAYSDISSSFILSITLGTSWYFNVYCHHITYDPQLFHFKTISTNVPVIHTADNSYIHFSHPSHISLS